MKVLLIGGEPVDYTLAFANGLAAHAEVTLILPKRRFEALQSSIDPSITLHMLDWPRHSSLSNPAFMWRLTRLIHAEKPDVIHLLSNTVLWLNLAVPFWRRFPLVTTVHDVSLHPGDRDTAVLPAWSPRLMARQSDDLVVHGETLREAAAGTFRKPVENVHVLPHPAMYRYADIARDKGLRRQENVGGFTVLLFGRIYAYKGLDVLLQAEKLLGRQIPDLRIVIAGRGDDPWTLRHLMGRPERYDIRHRFIEDEEVAQLFLDSDLVVLPYREASQSGVLFVAAAFGKPVVVTDVGELRASVVPDRLGMVVPPGDPAQLAQAIAAMAACPERLSTCGNNARRWAETTVSPDVVGAGAVALYRRLHQKV